MRTHAARTVFRKDYTPPSYCVDTVEMGFDLDPIATVVSTRAVMRRNAGIASPHLQLHGEELELLSLRMNGAIAQGAPRLHAD